MRVQLLAVGDELLLGSRENSHAAWLGQRLTEAGIDVVRAVVVADDPDAIVAALTDGASRAGAVVVTGGLGPTSDDRTREALAVLAGVALRRDPNVERALRGHYESLGVPPRPAALAMADVPRGATLLANEYGTAPGLRLELGAEHDHTVIYALPGVAREMEAMFVADVLPDLRARSGDPAVAARVLRTAMMPESAVAQRLAGLEAEVTGAGHDLAFAYLASPGQVRIRIRGSAATKEEAETLVAGTEERARELLGDSVYGTGDDTLDVVVHRLLARHGATVAVAESLTGGVVGEWLTTMPGSSRTFRGGVIAYSTDLKESLLGVPAALLAARGAVDAEIALAMADGVRERLGSTFGLGLTGVAGPEPQEGKPPGTVHVGLAGPHGRGPCSSLALPGHRTHRREHAAACALDLLRAHLVTLGSQEG